MPPPEPLPLDPDAEHAFHRLVGRLDYPMFVVTTAAADDGERSGCLVGFATQCSIHPPRWAVWLSVVNHTCRVARRAELLAVHALSAANRDLADLFGGESGDEVDKFARCDWSPGPGGVPLLRGVPGWFVARIATELPATGDHAGFLVDPVAAWAAEHDEAGLGYQSVKDVEPGHEP